MASKNLLVIDTDCGVDDAHAIMVALSDPNCEVLAITCISGNVGVDKVWYNVHRVLDVCDKRHIPVYKGATRALLNENKDTDFHGLDGLGDAPHTKLDVPPSMHHTEHAVDVLVSLANQHPGLITLVAIGPLTNLALAERIAPGFSSKLKGLCVMGGNMYGKGNVNPTSEYNFHSDPEAAHIVMESYTCPVTLITWELTMETEVELEWFEKLMKTETKKGNFLGAVSALSYKYATEEEFKAVYGCIDSYGWNCCDALAVSAALDHSIITEAKEVPCEVSLSGVTRGQLVADWNLFWAKKKPKRRFVMKIDMEKYKELLGKSVL